MAIFEVQTGNSATDGGRWVRVEAADAEAAKSKVRALGVSAGAVRLIDLAAPAAAASAATTAQRHPPGRMVCTKCGGSNWSGGRSFLCWLGVVLFFPIGLLLLLLRPKWRCDRCGFTYDDYTAPPDAKRRGSKGSGEVQWGLIVLLVLLVAMCAGVWASVFR